MADDSTKDQTDPALQAAQALLNEAQVKFLGDDPTRDQINSWFNACLNSACGPVGWKYGDIAVYGLLKVWTTTAEQKATAAEKRANDR